MSDKLFGIRATDEMLHITFDPPILPSYLMEIKAHLATEYKLADAPNASVRLTDGRTEVRSATVYSWRPHGHKFQDSILKNMARDIDLILADKPVERTRLTDLSRQLGLKG